MPLAQTAIYLTDTTGESTDWLHHWLLGAGAEGIHPIPTGELPWHLRQDFGREGESVSLVLLLTQKIDDEFLLACRYLLPFVEADAVGLVGVTCGEAPDHDSIRNAEAAGCLDLLHAEERSPPEGALARLRMAVNLVRERQLRLSRERMYKAQLAQRRVAEARLHYRANHDELTDLANRSAFERALDIALAEGKRRSYSTALLYVDVDRFKLHNEAVGHGAGDHLLQLIANLLRANIPPEYLVARLGSDEFAILVPGTDGIEARALAERLRAAVSAVEPDGRELIYHVGVSIGVTVMAPGATRGASQALAQAEQACYVAKTCGGNAVHQYSDQDEALHQMHEDMCWSQPIRRALAENRFFLAFQPILDIARDRISHYEALIRIPTALGGDGESARFLMAAERLGLARQIDLWMVENSIRFLEQNGEISLGVNLSSHAFQEASLLPLLENRLAATAIAPERLTFEITETAAIMNFAQTRELIGAIRKLGCRFALDDFGSGFSSYSYIKQFPVDMLKIDGSFVIGMRTDPRDQTIVKSMVDIGHGLEKEVVAEFIEDEETFRLLAGMGVDYAQGYFIGRPTPEIAPRRRKEEQ